MRRKRKEKNYRRMIDERGRERWNTQREGEKTDGNGRRVRDKTEESVQEKENEKTIGSDNHPTANKKKKN